jgi:predicted secreted protein
MCTAVGARRLTLTMSVMPLDSTNCCAEATGRWAAALAGCASTGGAPKTSKAQTAQSEGFAQKNRMRGSSLTIRTQNSGPANGP